MRARKREHYEDFQIRITDHKTKQKTEKAGREKDVRNRSRARGADYTPLGYKFFLSISYLFHTVRPSGVRAGTKGTPCVLAHAPRTSATRQARPSLPTCPSLTASCPTNKRIPPPSFKTPLSFPENTIRYHKQSLTPFPFHPFASSKRIAKGDCTQACIRESILSLLCLFCGAHDVSYRKSRQDFPGKANKKP